MKKQLKTKKLELKTETVRNLTEKQLDGVVGGASVVIPSQANTARCQTAFQV